MYQNNSTSSFHMIGYKNTYDTKQVKHISSDAGTNKYLKAELDRIFLWPL